MNIKLLALDLDGTLLLNDHASVSPATVEALTAVSRKGVHVVISTGRVRHRMPKSLEAIEGIRYAVTSNGATVVDLREEQTIYARHIAPDAALAVLAVLREYPIFIQLYSGGYDYVEPRQMDYFNQLAISDERKRSMMQGRRELESQRLFIEQGLGPVEKFNVPYLPPAYSEEIWARMREIDGVFPTASFPENIEVNAEGASKADGLARLCAHLGFTRENVMAMGDSMNDLEMLEFACLPIAMGNASEQVKAMASDVCASNEQDGVAEAVRKYLL